MNRIWPAVFAGITVGLLVAGSVHIGNAASSVASAEGTVQAFLGHIRAHDFNGAYNLISSANNIDRDAFVREWNGQNGSLRTFSGLQDFETNVLHEDDNSANVRANLKYSTAVGAFYETRDFKLMHDSGAWKLDYHTPTPQSVAPQVITENYL